MGRNTSLYVVILVGVLVYSSISPSTSREVVPNFAPSKEELAAQLSQLISQSTEELKKFNEASLLTQQELAKYKHLLPPQGRFTLPGHAQQDQQQHQQQQQQRHKAITTTTTTSEDTDDVSPHSDRFAQVTAKEPVSSALIRNALYATQPVSDPPQATISVDALENVDDVVKNATDVATFSDDGLRDFFEEELYRMKLGPQSARRLKSLKNNAQLLRSEVTRLMTHKPEPPEPVFMKTAHREAENRTPLNCGCKE